MRARVELKKVVLSNEECSALKARNVDDLVDAIRIWTSENCGEDHSRSDFDFVAEEHVFGSIESRERASEIFQYVVSKYFL